MRIIIPVGEQIFCSWLFHIIIHFSYFFEKRYICKKLIMDIWVKIVIFAIILHLVLGFGWLIYKLSPRKKSPKDQNELK